MSRITVLGNHIATMLNEAASSGDLTFPDGVTAVFKAFFNQDVENLQSATIVVCPHDLRGCRISRTSCQTLVAFDIAIRYKYLQSTPESIIEEYGELADSICDYLNGMDLRPPYVFESLEYYPYHAESLEQVRTFVSVIKVCYKTFEGYLSRI